MSDTQKSVRQLSPKPEAVVNADRTAKILAVLRPFWLLSIGGVLLAPWGTFDGMPVSGWGWLLYFSLTGVCAVPVVALFWSGYLTLAQPYSKRTKLHYRIVIGGWIILAPILASFGNTSSLREGWGPFLFLSLVSLAALSELAVFAFNRRN